MQTPFKFSLSILLAIFVAPPISAQSTQAVDKALAEFLAQDAALGRLSGNLTKMSLSPGEAEYLPTIEYSIQNVRSSAIAVNTVSGLYSLMIDPRDTAIVRQYASLHCDVFGKRTAISTKYMNEGLARVKTPALVQEITKARGIVQQLSQSNLCKLFPASKF